LPRAVAGLPAAVRPTDDAWKVEQAKLAKRVHSMPGG
jgi:hypothetical protein